MTQILYTENMKLCEIVLNLAGILNIYGTRSLGRRYRLTDQDTFNNNVDDDDDDDDDDITPVI